MRTLLHGGLAFALGCALAGCNAGGQEAITGAIEIGPCHVGGCSGELCSEQEGLASPCLFKPELACYREAAICEPQQDGACGWTQTPQLVACLAAGGPADGGR